MLKNKIEKNRLKKEHKNNSSQPDLTCQTYNPGYDTTIISYKKTNKKITWINQSCSDKPAIWFIILG
jgi:hypothetical protein